MNIQEITNKVEAVPERAASTEKPSSTPSHGAVDALTILTQKVTHTRIIVKLLTCGRSREVLSDDEADELDWMLLYGLQAIEEAADAVGAAVRGGRVSA